MLEIPGASFMADQETIFDEVNYDYIRREIEWYESQSLYVKDIPGGAPTIWKQVASPETGMINSNYGALIYSWNNGGQYDQVLKELRKSPTSRRAVMIYTRPTMHVEYCQDGMSDFICTNAVQYLLRDGILDTVVQMRSNDVRMGYRNDRAWAKHVQKKLANDLSVLVGDIYWQCGSLHVYEKDFYLVSHYLNTGAYSIMKAEYKAKYPESPWSK